MSEFVMRLPDVGEGLAQAEVTAWRVAVGDVVAPNDAVVEVMTDKATVELPSPVAGRVARLGPDVGDVVAVGSDLAWITTNDDRRETTTEVNGPAATAVDARPPDATSTGDAPAPPAAPIASGDPARRADGEIAQAAEPHARTLAAPAVRRRAQRLGVDLADVAASGPGGRVVHEDLDDVVARRSPPPLAPAGSGDVEEVRVVGLRRNIARRMQEAHRIPHFSYVEELDVTELERLRAELNESRLQDRPRLTVLPFLVRAIVLALADAPQINARYRDDDGIAELHRAVHVGIAVQTDRGLMVPVVRHAEQRDIWAIAAEVARLSDAARAGTVTLTDLSGSTITVTSLGALGGIVSTPIINAPEVAIVGVNKIAERPVRHDGTWTARSMMNLSSSFDHRIVDGWDAARFIQRIKTLIESPALLFVP